MGKRLSKQDKQFIKDNWETITNTEMAKSIGASKQTITIVGRELGLQDKRELLKRGSKLNSQDLKEIEKYNLSSATIKEAEGRKKTSNIIDLREKFILGQELKFRTFDGLNARKIIEGKIIQKTEHLLIIKAKNETISLAYRDFYTRKTIII